jgi:NADH oxidase (H2O2-forming)
VRVIAVIGSGIAGDEAAHAARRTDPKAQVVMVTEEPQPLYSACVLADYVAGEISRERVFLRRYEDYGRQGIELHLAERVVQWSPSARLLQMEDKSLTYNRLVLATGSQPVVPALKGAQLQGVYTLKTLQDADRLIGAAGRSAVVVGSGPVGIESAVGLQRRGWNVALIELMDRLLPRCFDAPLAASLTERLQASGIAVHVGERVVEISGKRHVTGIVTERHMLKADLVVLVVGMRPAVELAASGKLNLGNAGGIQVDETMRTGRPGVWACGDCVETEDRTTGRRGLFMLWSNARLQGRVAGANAAGAARRYPGSLNITTVNLFGEAAASVGWLASELPEAETRIIQRRGTWGELRLVLQEGRLRGVQALGRTERVGGLLGLIVRGDALRNPLTKGPASVGGREAWALRGTERELLHRLADGKPPVRT